MPSNRGDSRLGSGHCTRRSSCTSAGSCEHRFRSDSFIDNGPCAQIAAGKESVAPPLPTSFRLRVTYLPDGFIEVKDAQGVAYSFGVNASTSREFPGFFRVWMRTISGGRPEFIIAIAERAGQSVGTSNPARKNTRVDLQMRPGARVSVSPGQEWDIRWTERGVGIRFIVHAPTVASDNIKRLIAGVQVP